MGDSKDPKELLAADRSGTFECSTMPKLEPCAIVIFGATGDLTSRKLFPALYKLYASEDMPDGFVIMGVGRTEYGDDAFRDKMREALEEFAPNFDHGLWHKLASRLYYHTLEYDELDGYKSLEKRLQEIDKNEKANGETQGNRLFYLAVPPELYTTIANHLGDAGLAAPGQESGWPRIVVEKPFGHDLPSARELDAALHRSFSESQIFRIDHYLAKETVQNILMLRFANAIFEPLWNRNYIDYVSIIAAESLGVGHRAGYYDTAGVLRDMFQNHMMQLLALSAMSPPSSFHADRVRDEKTRVYRSLRPFDVEREFKDLVLGQYMSGTVHGEKVPAYRKEKNVPEDSNTPTFAMLRAYLDNWRWQGVPFYITSGKRLADKVSRIVVQFKEIPHSMLRGVVEQSIEQNKLFLGIYPDEVIHMYFMAKQPAPLLCLSPVYMHYGFKESGVGPELEAYEKVLLDCIMGDQMLFWRQDGVELTWGFLTPILEMCDDCGTMERHLHRYKAGSWGPNEACELHPGFFADVTTSTS
ncbi:glucose-6-phosphate dehydrogenase [Oceanidesulfovibrio marinus]|uniref:Glucose-6-phosphate 1-dehydrogenase n=1 Tax=Oceanidesulfovibrio marinus TaxID=370038 RepID=A0A6P1ZBF2_9BACT|nr:glucose-6-phosphate dehydrogenase [Oceanidesulfovibrio marinus]QJT11179.1 glucose-6-phosphate dehydrogenase [Oceanidesulfovibrio marinus]TVM31224.1 glucose-6-phosphate dehydrogenase [Oceanidesulfovibrio marinus]